MTVNVYVGTAGTGICGFERPGYIGRNLGPTDFDDQYLSVAFYTALGSGYVVQPGDRLEFDIMFPAPLTGAVLGPPQNFVPWGINFPGDNTAWTDATSRTTIFMGLDMKFVSGPYLSDINVPGPPLDFATGINITHRGDKISIADGLFHHMVVDLLPYAGLTMSRTAAVIDEDTTHRYVMYLKNVLITNGGNVSLIIYQGTPNGFSTTAITGNGGSGTGFKLETGLIGPLLVFGGVGSDEIVGPYASPSTTITTGTTFTAGTSFGTIYSNSGTGNMTVTLYLANAVTAGRRLTLINLHATKTLTVARGGSDLIDGATTKGPFGQYAGITIESNGLTAWHKIT